MINQMNKLAGNTINQALVVAETIVGVSRAAAEGTSQLMFKVKKPLRDAAGTGIRLNTISHKSVEKLVKVQARAIERSVDAGAARLALAARAPSLKALIDQQVSLLPETQKRLKGDLRDTWQVFVDAGTEIGDTLGIGKSNGTGKTKPRGKRKSAAVRKTRAGRKPASKRAKTKTRRVSKKVAAPAKAVKKAPARRAKAKKTTRKAA